MCPSLFFPSMSFFILWLSQTAVRVHSVWNNKVNDRWRAKAERERKRTRERGREREKEREKG